MRLTYDIRHAFLKAVLADIPRVEHVEEARKLVHAAYVHALPPAVATVWKNPHLREWVSMATVALLRPANMPREAWHRWPSWTFTVPSAGVDHALQQVLSAEDMATLHTLAEAHMTECSRVDGLQRDLWAVADGCKTRAQLVAQLPDLEKYIPKPDDPTPKLPVVANVVSALREAGWPAGKK